MDQYDDDSPAYTTIRADNLLNAGDRDEQRVWKRIAAAIEELTTVGKGTRH